MKKISIVIVTYNSEKLIGQCLKSVYKNTIGLDLEVIVIDNISQDKTVEVVRKGFSRVRFIENHENVGFARAVNQGIKMAQGEYILLMNPDMQILDGAIVKALEFSEKKDNIGIVGGQLLYPDTKKPQASFGNFPSMGTELLYALGWHKILPFGRFFMENIFSRLKFKRTRRPDWVSGGFMMIKKRVIEKIGYLDEKFFMYLEDIDFCHRAKKAGFLAYYFPEAKVIHNHMASSRKDMSRPLIYEARSLIYYFEKYKLCVGCLKFLIHLRFNLRILDHLILSVFGRGHKEAFEANQKAKKEILNQNNR